MNITTHANDCRRPVQRHFTQWHMGRAGFLLLWRPVALVAYLFLAMLEPFVGVVLSVLAFGSFAVAILFGFVLQVPFPHRWHVLGASFVFMIAYGVYLGVMRLLQDSLK